jgi:hypothetical protein
MARGRERYKSAKKNSSFKINLNLKKVGLILLLLCAIGYLVYVYISFMNLKSINPLVDDNTQQYLLTENPNTFRKTLIVFENKYGEDQDRIEKVYMYAHNEEKDLSILIYIPNWILYTGLENDFGNAVAVSGFKYAGEFIEPGKGVEFAIWQLEELLGMKVDNYIWFDSNAYNLLQENLGEVIGNTMYSQYYQNGSEISEDVFFLNGFVSRLNWFNLIFSASKFKDRDAVIYSSYSSLPIVVAQMKSINESIFKLKPFVIDLGMSMYLDSKENESGGIQNFVKLSVYDSVWRQNISRMIDKELEKERVRVEVYNASDISGLASSFARKIANSGCEVVRFDNAPNTEDFTKFYISNETDFEKSTEVVTGLFSGQYEILNSRPSFMTTGDIVIILGKDISRMYSF